MKTLKRIGFLFVMVAGAALAFTSCTENEEGDAITLTFDSDASLGYYFDDATVEVGTKVRIGAIATAEKKIESAEFVRENNGQTSQIEIVENINEKNFTYDFDYTTSSTAGVVETLTVIITDKNGNTKQRSITITTEEAGAPLTEAADQQFHNFIGPNAGAYDLVGLKSVTSSESDNIKDLMDQTTTSNPTFSKAWGTKNGAEFIMNPGVTYLAYKNGGKTKTDLATLWTDNAANKTSSVSNLKEGDLILVKSGQTGNPVYMINLHTITDGAGNDDTYKFDILY